MRHLTASALFCAGRSPALYFQHIAASERMRTDDR
jgi:hypothetical protein